MLKRTLAAALAATALAAAAPSGETNASDAIARIRDEAATRSQILKTLHVFTDVYGPRLTGSPNAKAAAEWAVKTMAGWGFANAHVEPWDFGHPGWTNERASAVMISPTRDQLAIEPVAWTPGTNGTITAQVVQLQIPENPTVNDLTTYLESVRGRVRGRIVLAGRAAAIAPRLTPRPARREDEALKRLYDPDAPPAASGGRRNASQPGAMSRGDISVRIDQFLKEYGGAARINDAARDMGQIAAFHNPTYDASRVLPTVVMRNEDYGRLSRLLADNLDVQLELTVVNRSFPEGRTSYNAIAEIPGTDRRDQVVMLGGHLDSWHSATGATDNAIGCAVMMEAARILIAAGLEPRRTIRVALWTGEEQGLLGSQAYVRQHFGTFEDPKPQYGSLVAYMNLDNGTGRIRGARVFGPRAAVDTIRRAFAPFADLGVVGAVATARRTLGDTDSYVFSAAGLPAITFDQDPIQYDGYTHHTNLDTYERVIEDDVKASAAVVAATLYELATRDQPLARFDRTTMPAASWR